MVLDSWQASLQGTPCCEWFKALTQHLGCWTADKRPFSGCPAQPELCSGRLHGLVCARLAVQQ